MRLLRCVLAVCFCLWLLSNVSAVEPEPFGKCGFAFKMEGGIEVEFHNCDLVQADITAIRSAKGLHSLILGYLPEGVYFSDTGLLKQLSLTVQFAERLVKLPNLKILEIADPGISGEFMRVLKSRMDWEKLTFNILHRVRSDTNTSQKGEK